MISKLRLILPLVAWTAVVPASAGQEAGLTCVPVSERGSREFGCFILANQPLARLNSTAVFWHLDRFPSRALAEAAG